MTHSEPSAVTIGQIAYLNVLPFFGGATFDGYRLRSADPRTLGKELQAGAIQAAPVPIVDLWRFRDTLEPLGDFGIASWKRANSVLLCTRIAPENLSNVTITVTQDSSTSIRMLWVLLRERWGVESPVLERGADDASAEAILLIGDPALARRGALEESGYRLYDLGEEWFALTDHPFVFAQWAVHRAVAEQTRRDLVHRLDAALERNLADLASLYQSEIHGRLLNREELVHYLSQFTFRFSKAEYAGMHLFQQKVEKYGLLGKHL